MLYPEGGDNASLNCAIAAQREGVNSSEMTKSNTPFPIDLDSIPEILIERNYRNSYH
jgi:hypothetical protein